jgi:hypothetical protein
MMEVIEHNIDLSRAEKGVNWLTQKFFGATLLPWWTDMGKRHQGFLATNRIVDVAQAMGGRGKLNNKLTDIDRGWIANLGISENDAKQIRDLIDAGVIRRDGSVWEINTSDWMDDRFIPDLVDRRNFWDQKIKDIENRPAPAKTFRKRDGKETVASRKAREQFKKNQARELAEARQSRARDIRAARRVRREFVMNVRGAIATETDRGIITPGVGDAPLIDEGWLGRHALQFKSFLLASNQRLLMSGLQGRKLWLAQHIVAGAAIGMFVEWAKVAEREGVEEANKFVDNPGRWITAGIDRSGTLAVLFEMNNTAEKYLSTPGLFTSAQYLADDEGDMQGMASRYANRNIGDMISPSLGLAKDVVTITNALMEQAGVRLLPEEMIEMMGMGTAEGGVSEAQINAFMRTTPGMGLPYIRGFVRPQAEEFLKETVGRD